MERDSIQTYPRSCSPITISKSQGRNRKARHNGRARMRASRRRGKEIIWIKTSIMMHPIIWPWKVHRLRPRENECLTFKKLEGNISARVKFQMYNWTLIKISMSTKNQISLCSQKRWACSNHQNLRIICHNISKYITKIFKIATECGMTPAGLNPPRSWKQRSMISE